MTSAWLLYGIVVGVLVALGARGAQAVGRLAGFPVRWTWAGAIVLTLVLSGLAPYRTSTSADNDLIVGPDASSTSDAQTGARGLSRATLPGVVEGAGRGLIDSIETAIAGVQDRLPQSVERYLIAIWLLVSSLLALGMITIHIRLRKARRHWPTTFLRGVQVRIAPEVGPAVIGLTRPDIIVPRWLLDRDQEEQQLVLAHEVEHLHSRDHLLLAAACAAVVLVPWNPAVWCMLAQLRLSVELDCDARVLRRGVAPRRYGALLIDLAEHYSGFRLGAATLAESSHLSQRLNAMKPDIPSFARTRGIVIGVLAFSAVLIACETSMPTSTQMSSAGRPPAPPNRFSQASDSDAVFMVDGAVVPAAVARAVPQPQILQLDILQKSGKKPQVHILTRTAAEAVHAPDTVAVNVASAAASLHEDRSTAKQRDPWQNHHVMDPKAVFPGLMLIDGVRVDRPVVDALSPGNVAGFELMKGSAAAVARYNDPLAADGVMAITTRR